MADTLIEGALVLDPASGRLLADVDVATTGGLIARVGPEGATPAGWRPEARIDGRERVVLPGFVNTHHHVPMSLLRGYADDMSLMPWLRERIWPVEAHMTEEDVYWGAVLGIAEMLAGGTTCFADMYFNMAACARAVEETGIRAVLAHGCIGLEDAGGEADLQATERLVSGWQGAAGGRIRTMVAPHAPYTCPPDYLARVLDLAAKHGVPVHTHLNETMDEVAESLERYGCRPIERMAREGLFQHRVLAAHVVHPSEEELELLAGADVWVAHNPVSNLKLASGVAPVPALLAKGVPVTLGTDGMASTNRASIFTQMRAAAWVHKATGRDARLLPAAQVLRMATWEGGRALGWEDLGRLQPGAPADLVVLNRRAPHLVPPHDPVSSVVYAATDADVHATMVDGRLLYRDGEFLTVDVERALHEATRRAGRLAAAAGQ